MVMCGELMSDDREVIVSVCANCGKEGSDINNTCNKCKLVKYCNAACKKKHRHKHKKECEEHLRLAAERAAKLHDEKLYKEPASQFGDCQICFIRLPWLSTGRVYMACCGKVICHGCSYAPVYDNQGNTVDNHKCPFCRIPGPSSDEEMLEREKKRAEKDDPHAICQRGYCYQEGLYGFPKDYRKALEWYRRAGELDYATAYCHIGFIYEQSDKQGVDKEKVNHYYELAAMGGDVTARYNLGLLEKEADNIGRALKHYMIAVQGGSSDSLKAIQKLYSNGHVTKDVYTKALHSYQVYLGDIKSVQRDEAAAAYEKFCYF